MPRPEETLTPAEARELAALEADLEPVVASGRADPRTPWAAELDRRVAAGFPRSRRVRLSLPRLGGRLLMPALGAATCAVIALVVVVAATSGGGGSPSAAGLGAATEAAPSTGSRAESAPSDAAPPTVAPSSGTAATPAPTGGRRIERSAALVLGVAPSRMQSTSSRVFAVASDFDGIVDSSSVSSGDRTGGATFAMRFPADRVSEAVNRLAGLGHVRTQTSGTRDVTRGFISARGRLRDATAERAGLLRALAGATDAGRIDALKRRLHLVEGRIAAARGEVRRLQAATDFARVQLTLEPEHSGAATPTPDDGWDPGDALRAAGRILAACAGAAVVGLAVLVPLGALLGLAWGARSALRRRRRHAALQSV
jgi:hypothetical protein